MITRRSILRLSALGAPLSSLATVSCTRPGAGGFRGYAFVANEEGQAVAALDLQAMALIKHIALGQSPAVVLAPDASAYVYAFSTRPSTVFEIDPGKLALKRQATIAGAAERIQISADAKSAYVLGRDPRAILTVNLETLKVTSKLALPDDPIDFDLSPVGQAAAVTTGSGVRIADLQGGKLSVPLVSGDLGEVRFLADGKTLVVADKGRRRLSLFDVASRQVLSHLSLSVRPDNLCFNSDGGQLFVTGEGRDAVAVVYPYHTPEVAETVLAGRAPGPMGASKSFLFVASPSAGDVTILNIATRKAIAVLPVGSDPGAIAITPDDQYALVLNRKSGDVAVIRTGTITPNRYKSAALLTVIPAGSRPVSAAIRAA